MKKLLLLLFLLPSITFGQTTVIPEPEYANQPYFLNDKNKLEKIERIDARIEYKVKGAGKVEYYLTAFNKNSLKRFSNNTTLVFIVKMNTDEDPANFISVTSAILKRKRRRFIFDKNKRGKATDISKYNVTVNINRVKENIFKISINELEPGEYAFKPFSTTDAQSILGTTPTTKTIYCFGIDQ